MREIIVRLSINRKRKTKTVFIFKSHIHFELFAETIILKVIILISIKFFYSLSVYGLMNE
jgi:hypothetical protein